MAIYRILSANFSRWFVTAATDVQKVPVNAGFSRGVFINNLYYFTSVRIETAV